MQMYLIVPPAGASTPPAHSTVERDARKAAHEIGGTVEPVEVPSTKAELKEYLNRFAGRFAAQICSAHPAAANDKPEPAPRAGYHSPFDASTTIQKIDGSLIASAIKQMDEPHTLAMVAGAMVERFNGFRAVLEGGAA